MPALFGSLPKSICVRLSSASYRRLQAGSLRSPETLATRREQFAPTAKPTTIKVIAKTNMYENTEFSTSRDIEAIQIPAGTKITIPAGTPGVITQSLGGSYTIATNFGLSRVAEKDGDALGLEKSESQPTASANGAKDGEVSEEDVWNQLRQCYDPEIPVNIVDLGLVYDCKLTKKDDGGTRVDVKMTLTAPGCGMGPAIAHDAQSKILTIDGVDEADVQLVWDPPWNQNMISEAGRMKLGMI